MSRAALLPITDDALRLRYWLRNADTWLQYVDEVVVGVMRSTRRIDQIDHTDECIAYLRAHGNAPPKVRFAKLPPSGDHGIAMDQLLQLTTADYVVFCEDDAWVCRPEAIDQCFQVLESGTADLVGSPRDTGTPAFVDAAQQQLGVLHTSTGESGSAFWPCFLFGRRDLFIQHVSSFTASVIPPGTPAPCVGMTAPVEWRADTAAVASWELRKAGLRVVTRPQFRVGNQVLAGAWRQLSPEWFHVGSLSSIHALDAIVGCRGTRESMGDPVELARRAFWWERVALTAPESSVQLEDLQRVARVIAGAGLSRASIQVWESVYTPWITWQETDPS